jgi:hypothetical protein
LTTARHIASYDVDTIEPGLDFAEAIAAAVGSCQVLLALIGDRWLDSTDRKGRRKLDDANDLVRLEIQAALERNIRVIPVLVDGVTMPTAEELPASLAGLARRQAFELSYSRFRDDARRLVDLLDRLLAVAPPGPATAATPARAVTVSQLPQVAEERPRTSREKSTVQRLVSAGSIPDGTPLTLRPTTEVTPEVRAAIEAWVNQDPRRGRARWYNDRRQPLAWDYNGGRYRHTEVVRRILADATGLQRSPRGPAWWVLEDGRDLPTVAGVPERSTFDWAELHRVLAAIPPAIGPPMGSWRCWSGPPRSRRVSTSNTVRYARTSSECLVLMASRVLASLGTTRTRPAVSRNGSKRRACGSATERPTPASTWTHEP